MFSAKRIRESAEADTISPVATIFRSRSRPCLTIIGRPEFPVQLAAILTPLNHTPDSDGGARIRLERPLALPDYFLVQITASGPLRRVRKCWHMNNEIGIEFCDR